MGFAEREKARLVAIRDSLFHDPGAGLFRGQSYPFVLRDAPRNLWAGIREDALAYFERNSVAWWGGTDGMPTGHLLSSQVACVNHLYALRQRADLASALLKAIDPEVAVAEVVDDGFVEFELTCSPWFQPGISWIRRGAEEDATEPVH